MAPVPQLPFSFAFESTARFDSFRTEPDNLALLHQLETSAHRRGQLTWLWGEPGAGKSHLLQAFCHLHRQAIYLPVGKMLDYEPDSLAALLDSELLVLDDIELLAGKPAWEEQLFALCRQLLATDGALVCAAVSAPAQAGFALADLRSRLQLALVYQVHALGDDGKQTVLMERAKARGIELKDEVAQFIMARHPRNLHDLMAVLEQLDRQALAEQRRLTIPFVKTALGW
ncbi:MAG TPA: DnaA regulatory inactivator Hda [Candidatus Acidoferrum sp.]|nr:DnaA regulatory inactivator Hda [Candidatus Acidoferrum sp.]